MDYPSEDVPEVDQSLSRDAFQIMLNANTKFNTAKLPPKVTVFCEKDTMYNDLLLLLETKELCWKSEEVQNGTATLALQTLRDALWYIDGMHKTLNERSCMIPKCFEQFTGYNRPEQHQHKKRCHTSMSRDILLAHPQALFGCLHNQFWGRATWSTMKNDGTLHCFICRPSA